jgi:S-(hydroxymethyl)glutathione dehydrogenase/alcohol dehydrogenase
LAGAHPIVAIDLFEHKLKKAGEVGATHTLDGRSPDLVEAIRGIVGPDGADIVIDGTGAPQIIQSCYALTAAKGRCILFGVMPHDKNVTLHTLPLHHGKVLTGSEGGSSHPHVDIPRIVRMIEDGRFDPLGFISHRTKLDEINETIGKMRSGEVIHALIHFD